MSLSVKKLGWAEPDQLASMPGALVLPTSVGTTIIVVPESNNAATNNQNNQFGNGTNTDQMFVYEVDAAGEVVTLRASWNTGVLAAPYNVIAADLFSDNSVGVVYKNNADQLVYRQVTYGTWALSNIVTVADGEPKAQMISLSVNRNNVPAVGIVATSGASPKLAIRFWIRRTDTAAWQKSASQPLINNQDVMHQLTSFDMSWSLGGTATARPLVFAAGSAQLSGEDYGVRVWSAVVSETTGAVGNVTLRKTLLAGNMSTKKWGLTTRRTFIFATGALVPEFTLAHMEATDKRSLLVYRFTWDANVFLDVIAPQPGVASSSKIDYAGRFTASYANDTINFYYSVPKGKDGVLNLVNFIARIDRTFGSVAYSGPYWWDNAESTNQDRIYPAAGTGRNAYQCPRHVMTMISKTNKNPLFTLLFWQSMKSPAPYEVTPADADILLTAVPALSAKIRLGKAFGQSRYKLVWQFALDSSFTTSVRTYVQTDDKFVLADGTERANTFMYVADVLPAQLTLSSGNWFVRAAIVDEFNITGDWSVAGQVTFSHPPSPASITPNGGTSVGDGAVAFAWVFTDPLESDVQTAFQVIVENNGVVIYDSGKVNSSAALHSATMPAGNTGAQLRWTVRLWDSDNVPGEYAPYETFTIATPPSVVVNTPVSGSTVLSGTPNILFTVGCATSRNIKAYQVTVTQGGQPVAQSGPVPTAATNGTQLAWRPDNIILDNGNYAVQVTVTDNAGMQATSPAIDFTVNQVAPLSAAGVFISDSLYNRENGGYLTVNWTDTARDADFQSWIVERRADEIDSRQNVVEIGTWEEVGQVTTIAANYVFKDYLAPAGLKVNYRVRQLVNRAGDRAISTGDTVTWIFPKSEGYWIIVPDGSGSFAFYINVISDSYDIEYESNSYVVAGRGRHVDKGERLGVSGSLGAQLRDTATSTARQKKRQLEMRALDSSGVGYLRTPFGDVLPISITNMSVDRIAGVGLSEFVDVDIPYTEVGL